MRGEHLNVAPRNDASRRTNAQRDRWATSRPSSAISVSCPQAFLACGRTRVLIVFYHLRSRVFANERPTVPSIFNVYGDSGECPNASAILIDTPLQLCFTSKASVQPFRRKVDCCISRPPLTRAFPLSALRYSLHAYFIHVACASLLCVRSARASVHTCAINPSHAYSFIRIEIRV